METKDVTQAVHPKDSVPPLSQNFSTRFLKPQEVEFNIKNHPILENISKKYELHTDSLQTPGLLETDTFFTKLDLSSRIELDHGEEFFIHVQPDLRYAVQYFMFTTAKEYPDLNIKGFPSLPTIVAYKLALFINHILICDITSCKPTSQATEEFNNNPPLTKFLQDLKYMPVPQDVKVLIDYLNLVLHTQRKTLKFVPSLAGFSLLHDFGYSIPISCFIAMHHDIVVS